MDDKFLNILREEPDADFVKNLREKLSESGQPQSRWAWGTSPDTARGSRKTRFVTIVGLFLFVLIVALAITPVGAIIFSYPIEVAGRIFEVSDDYPGDDDDNVSTIEPQVMSLDEALAAFPYPVKLPNNVPPEYILDDENVQVYLGVENWPENIDFSWKGEGRGLSLNVCGNCDWERGEIIAPDAVEEVFLDNQHPAILVRGGWYENEKAWNYDIALTLEWEVDNILYRLSTGTMLPGHLSPEELIEIAISTIEKE